MNKIIYAVLAVSVLVFVTPMTADARRARFHVGTNIRIGTPYRYPPPVWRARPVMGGGRAYWGRRVVVRSWYPAVYYAAPAVVIGQQQPYVYEQPQEEPPQYWYYCQDTQTYYPYVKNCPGGWMKVVPEVTPPNQ